MTGSVLTTHLATAASLINFVLFCFFLISLGLLYHFTLSELCLFLHIYIFYIFLLLNEFITFIVVQSTLNLVFQFTLYLP